VRKKKKKKEEEEEEEEEEKDASASAEDDDAADSDTTNGEVAKSSRCEDSETGDMIHTAQFHHPHHPHHRSFQVRTEPDFIGRGLKTRASAFHYRPACVTHSVIVHCRIATLTIYVQGTQDYRTQVRVA